MMHRAILLSAALAIAAPSVHSAPPPEAGTAAALWEQANVAIQRGTVEIATNRAIRIEVMDGDKIDRIISTSVRFERDPQGKWVGRPGPDGLRLSPEEGSTKSPGTPTGVVRPDVQDLEPRDVFVMPLRSVKFTGKSKILNGERCRETAFTADGVKGTILFRESDGRCVSVRADWEHTDEMPNRTEFTDYEADSSGGLRPVRTLMEAERRFGLFMKRTIKISIDYEDYTRR